MSTYTLRYRSVARNLSASAQAVAMQTAPVDTDTATLYGLTLVSDVASTADPTAIRTVVFVDGPLGIIPAGPPGTQMAEVLTNLLTSAITQAIQAPVTADPVVVS